MCQALIMAPTRALIQQIQKVVEALGSYMTLPFRFLSDGINTKMVTILSCGPRLVVETPGSVLNTIKSGGLKTSSIRMFVVYGADSMASKGFRVQVHDVFQRLHSGTQAVFLSTKMPMEVTEIMAKFKREPIRIVIEKGVATEFKADLRDRGRGKGGAQAGYIVPSMGNGQSLTQDGHKVGKGRKHPATTTGGRYHKGLTKKNELTQEHSKDPCLPLTSDQWPQRDEIVDNQDEVGVDGDDIDGNQGEIDDNDDDKIDDQDGIDRNQGKIIDSFDNMNLRPELIRGINVYGYVLESHKKDVTVSRPFTFSNCVSS